MVESILIGLIFGIVSGVIIILAVGSQHISPWKASTTVMGLGVLATILYLLRIPRRSFPTVHTPEEIAVFFAFVLTIVAALWAWWAIGRWRGRA